MNLRRIEPEELPLGEPLRGALRDRVGHVLVPQGRIFTAATLTALRQRAQLGVYIGGDWFRSDAPSASPTPVAPCLDRPPEELNDPAVVAATLRALRGEHASLAPRRHRRHTWKVKLRLELEEITVGGRRKRALTVTSSDISVQGFSFHHRNFIHPGTLVRARVESLPDRPVLAGVVRNCVHLEGSRHRIGVEFQ